MKITKEIDTLLKKRREYGELANMYDAMVLKWCAEHGVDLTDIQNDFGCMLTTEPRNYEKMTRERIMETPCQTLHFGCKASRKVNAIFFPSKEIERG